MHRLEQGITYVVATRGSGLMLSRGYAERCLSATACRRAVRFGEYYSYDMGSGWAVVMWEIVPLRGHLASIGRPEMLSDPMRHLGSFLKIHEPEYAHDTAIVLALQHAG